MSIESILGIEHGFENPLAGRAVRTIADVETAASDVRRVWDLGSSPVTNLLGLLEEKGIRVFEVRGIEGSEGLSGNYGAVPFVTVNRDFPDDRVRFMARSLGFITGREFRKFRETIRANGWLVTEPVEYRGNEQAVRLRRLLSYAVTERIFAPERAAALVGVPVAEFMGELGEIF